MATRYEVDQYINHVRSLSDEERVSFAKEAKEKLYEAILREIGEEEAGDMLYTLVAFFILQAGQEGVSDKAYDFLKKVYGFQISKDELLDKINDVWGEEQYNRLMELIRNIEVDEYDCFTDLGIALYTYNGEIDKPVRSFIYGLCGA